MGKRIFLIVILVAAVALGYFYYKHHQDEVRLASGDVTCDGCMTPAEHARFLRENAGEVVDTQSDRRTKVATASDPGVSGASAGSVSASTTNAASSAQPAQTAATMTPSTAPAGNSTIASNDLSTPPPASDTVSPNPTNGMVFSGKGSYQWYRQGNLTWRVDTTSGRSCIIYATMDEWRKKIVMSHGCGRSA